MIHKSSIRSEIGLADMRTDVPDSVKARKVELVPRERGMKAEKRIWMII